MDQNNQTGAPEMQEQPRQQYQEQMQVQPQQQYQSQGQIPAQMQAQQEQIRYGQQVYVQANGGQVYQQVNMQPQAQPAPIQFFTTIPEKVISILVLPVCFLYASMFFEQDKTWNIMFGIFVLLLLVMGEVMYWNRKRTWESWAMMLMTIIGAVSVCFSIGEVWDNVTTAFFTHLFGVYWILCRSGRLAEGKTSHMMVWDGITGFCVMPFKNWPLDLRTIISIFKVKGERKNRKVIPVIILASIVGIILFFIAISYLRNADDTYDDLMRTIGDFLKIEWDVELIPKLFIMAFVGTWLYGLLGGCFRETEEQVRHRGDNVKGFIEKLRKVPGLVWVIFIGLFTVFYIMFFVIQGNYLFDAFAQRLPEEFTYSQYARKGFGDMCGVMVVNFIMLWLSTRTSGTKQKAVKIACALLNFESMLFAVIAFLKIKMYISAYGFTPLRFQSIWAATVLFFACICVSISMFSGKKTARIWFFLSAASLAALCLV